jgi:hypothetical protein
VLLKRHSRFLHCRCALATLLLCPRGGPLTTVSYSTIPFPSPDAFAAAGTGDASSFRPTSSPGFLDLPQSEPRGQVKKRSKTCSIVRPVLWCFRRPSASERSLSIFPNRPKRQDRKQTRSVNAFAALPRWGQATLCLAFRTWPTLSGSVMVENLHPPLSASVAPNRRRVHR